MKAFILILLMGWVCTFRLVAQELYVATEPASNMARHSIGIRLVNEGMPLPEFKSRSNFELMVGVSKNLMLHANLYMSDLYQKRQQYEGFGVYAKYRFLSIDSVKRHFRAAVYGRYSNIKNPLVNDEINLEGDNTGVQAGLVVTQLLHKLALSGSVNYAKAYNNNSGFNLSSGQDRQSIGYTLSSGYLIFPKTYKDYKQTNVNVYLEFLGKTNTESGKSLMDVAPAVQLIFNSKLRVDLSQRLQLFSSMNRTLKNMYLVRFEYNLFNVF